MERSLRRCDHTPRGGGQTRGGGCLPRRHAWWLSDGDRSFQALDRANTADSDGCCLSVTFFDPPVAALSIPAQRSPSPRSTISHNKANRAPRPASSPSAAAKVHAAQQAQLADDTGAISLGSQSFTTEGRARLAHRLWRRVSVSSAATAAISNLCARLQLTKITLQPGATSVPRHLRCSRQDWRQPSATTTISNHAQIPSADSARRHRANAAQLDRLLRYLRFLRAATWCRSTPSSDRCRTSGGPTFTHSVLPTSPAIDGGDHDPARPGQRNDLATSDQRGVSRPQRIRCDVGAVEVDPCPPSPLAGLPHLGEVAAAHQDNGADGAELEGQADLEVYQRPAAAGRTSAIRRRRQTTRSASTRARRRCRRPSFPAAISAHHSRAGKRSAPRVQPD